jgi:secreted trypsin-like serine protease
MNASAVSVSVILFYVSWIGFLVPELKTASASFIERTDGPRKNLRHGAHRDEHTTGITDGGFENVETTRSLIIGGRDAEDYPRSIVFLSDRIDDLQCGGSLISPTIVLTAGHCEISLLHEAVFFRYEFDNPSESSEDIDPSSHSENEIRIKIKEEILHPEYERRTLQHDVMLVVLERSPNDVVGNETETNLVTIEGDDFPISRIENSPIVPYMQLHSPDNPSLQDLLDRIEERKAQNGEGGNSRSNNGKSPKTTDLELKALGWGHTVDGLNGNPSDVLQEVTLNYVPNEECEKAAENEQISYGDRITDDMMCTWESSRDTCHGDSGGPVVIANPNKESEIPFLQVGIISWGEDCADHVFPGGEFRTLIFSRVLFPSYR